jgi:hypothetical protein
MIDEYKKGAADMKAAVIAMLTERIKGYEEDLITSKDFDSRHLEYEMISHTKYLRGRVEEL